MEEFVMYSLEEEVGDEMLLQQDGVPPHLYREVTGLYMM
jgi:hypothetical protein